MNSFKCITELADFLQKEYPQASLPENWTVSADKCPPNMEGDLTINCFRFAKDLRSSPDKIADKVLEFFTQNSDIAKAEKIKAFVNVTLTPSAVYRDSVADIGALLQSSQLDDGEQKRVLIEYSAPNTNKPQHLGHVRNNTLGMSLASLLSRVGHDVIQINLVNDRGIHICKSMIAYERFGEGVTPETSGIKGDHLVGDFYVKYNDALKEQLNDLRAEKPELAEESDDKLFLETELGQATQKMLQDWENGDEKVISLWKRMNSWVFAGFEQTYKRMGIEFAHTYLESETYLLGKDIVADGLARGSRYN